MGGGREELRAARLARFGTHFLCLAVEGRAGAGYPAPVTSREHAHRCMGGVLCAKGSCSGWQQSIQRTAAQHIPQPHPAPRPLHPAAPPPTRSSTLRLSAPRVWSCSLTVDLKPYRALALSPACDPFLPSHTTGLLPIALSQGEFARVLCSMLVALASNHPPLFLFVPAATCQNTRLLSCDSSPPPNGVG